MNRIEKTADLHQKGMTCAQAILTVYGPSVGLDAGLSQPLGRPLCGINIGKFGLCGYITGAALLLGMSCDRSEESAARRATTAAIDAFCRRFKAKNGHLQCQHLVGADMRTPEGKKAVKEANLIARHCYGYGRDAATILEEFLPQGEAF